MRLNTLKPAKGAKTARKRVGRGIGSGLGKTAGRGHKGQKSRSGGMPKIGFEGGQMPMQRRLPKRGFRSRIAGDTAEVRLYELNSVKDDTITLEVLKAAGVVPRAAKAAKIINRGEINRAVTIQGVKTTKGAAEAITAASGKVE